MDLLSYTSFSIQSSPSRTSSGYWKTQTVSYEDDDFSSLPTTSIQDRRQVDLYQPVKASTYPCAGSMWNLRAQATIDEAMALPEAIDIRLQLAYELLQRRRVQFSVLSKSVCERWMPNAVQCRFIVRLCRWRNPPWVRHALESK